MLTEGPSVSDIIGDISEYDQDLIAAYVCAHLELVSKELNHLAAILHVYAGGLNFMN
jgi:hypothetical protein